MGMWQVGLCHIVRIWTVTPWQSGLSRSAFWEASIVSESLLLYISPALCGYLHMHAKVKYEEIHADAPFCAQSCCTFPASIGTFCSSPIRRGTVNLSASFEAILIRGKSNKQAETHVCSAEIELGRVFQPLRLQRGRQSAMPGRLLIGASLILCKGGAACFPQRTSTRLFSTPSGLVLSTASPPRRPGPLSSRTADSNRLSRRRPFPLARPLIGPKAKPSHPITSPPPSTTRPPESAASSFPASPRARRPPAPEEAFQKPAIARPVIGPALLPPAPASVRRATSETAPGYSSANPCPLRVATLLEGQ